ATALGEEGVFRVELHARRVVRRALAVLADAHVAGGGALHAAVLVIEDLRRREAGEDLGAQRFRLLAQPAGEIAEAAGIVAVIVEGRRQQEVRDADRPLLAQQEETVFLYLGQERRALFLPV